MSSGPWSWSRIEKLSWSKSDIYKHFIVPRQFTRHWRLGWVMMEWQMSPGVRGWSEHRVWGDHTGAWPLTVVSWSPDKDLLLWFRFLVRVLSPVAAEWIIMNKGEMIKWIQRVSISSPGSSASNNGAIVGVQLICFVKIIGQQFLGFHRTETSLALQKYKSAEIRDALYW